MIFAVSFFFTEIESNMFMVCAWGLGTLGIIYLLAWVDSIRKGKLPEHDSERDV